MSPKEAYKIGFMLKCAELGVDPETAATNLIKSANPLSAIAKALGIGIDAAKSLLMVGVPTALAGGAIAGGTAGHYAARATTPYPDIKEIRKDEETEAYEAGIAKLRKNLRQRGVNVDKPQGWFA